MTVNIYPADHVHEPLLWITGNSPETYRFYRTRPAVIPAGEVLRQMDYPYGADTHIYVLCDADGGVTFAGLPTSITPVKIEP
jgi:hypothetical protein